MYGPLAAYGKNYYDYSFFCFLTNQILAARLTPRRKKVAVR